MRKLPIFAAAVAAAAAIAIVRSQPSREATQPPSAPPISPYPDRVAAVGIVEANTENVAIGTHLPGVVEKVHVRVGQHVASGEPLFELDQRHLRAQLAVRRGSLALAQAQLGTAESQLGDIADQFERSDRLSREKVISTDEMARRRFALDTARSRVNEARAGIAAAEAQVQETETEIARSVVRSPLEGDVLLVNVRAGEFAPAGQTSQPLLVVGQRDPLNVRVDIDEHEAWRVRPEAAATGQVRGNPQLQSPLRFVRYEPMVVPKRSLTGASTERVDTRVLQAIYEVSDRKLPIFIGQQMDIFIDARNQAVAKNP